MRKITSLFALVLVIFISACSGGKQEKLDDPQIDAKINVELGHYWNLAAVAFSPDGKTLASSAYDGTILIWDFKTKHQVLAIRPHNQDEYTGNYLSLSYISDGTQLVAGVSGEIRIFDTQNGQKVKSIPVKGYDGQTLAVSMDEHYAAVEGEDYKIILVDLVNGNIAKTFEGHTKSIKDVAISSDNSMVAAASYDSTVIIWNLEDGSILKTIEASEVTVSVDFNEDADKLAFAIDNTPGVQVWDTKEMKQLTIINSEAEDVFFYGTNEILVHEYSKVKIFDIENGEEKLSFDDYGYSTAISDDEQYLAVASSKGVKVFDLQNNGQLVSEFGKDTRFVSKVHVSPTGRFIVTENSHKSSVGGPDILSYPVDTAYDFTAYSTSGSGANIMDFYGNKDEIFAEESYGDMIHYDLKNGGTLGKFEDKFTDPICITSDGKYVIAKSYKNSNTYSIFDAKTGEQVKELINSSAYHYFSGITPDDKYFVMLTMDFFKVWDITTGEEVKSYDREDMDDVVFVDMTNDGKYIVGRCDAYNFMINDIMTGENTFLVKDIDPISAAYNPDKNTVAIGCKDWSIKVFDIAQNAQSQTLNGHLASVVSLCYTPDGKYLLSSAQDNQMNIWDKAGNLLLTVVGLEKLGDYEGITKDWVAFAPNGRYDGSEAGIKQFLYFDKNGERLPAENYKDACYTPNLIGKTLGQNFIDFE